MAESSPGRYNETTDAAQDTPAYEAACTAFFVTTRGRPEAECMAAAVAALIAGGALAGVPIDIGVGQRLIHDASERLAPGTSALIALVSGAAPDLVMRALPATAWTTHATLSSAQEDRLRGAVENGVEGQSGHYDA
jgi:hypothetical protein